MLVSVFVWGMKHIDQLVRSSKRYLISDHDHPSPPITHHHPSPTLSKFSLLFTSCGKISAYEDILKLNLRNPNLTFKRKYALISLWSEYVRWSLSLQKFQLVERIEDSNKVVCITYYCRRQLITLFLYRGAEIWGVSQVL